MLTDAHATPYRLCQMGIKATPHCQYCLHEEGNIKHVIWDCPRFAELRRSWPQELLDRQYWPECSKSALICFASASGFYTQPMASVSIACSTYQWMEINRKS